MRCRSRLRSSACAPRSPACWASDLAGRRRPRRWPVAAARGSSRRAFRAAPEGRPVGICVRSWRKRPAGRWIRRSGRGWTSSCSPAGGTRLAEAAVPAGLRMPDLVADRAARGDHRARARRHREGQGEAGPTSGCRECGAGSVLGTPVATTGRATKENHHDDSADGPRGRRRRRPGLLLRSLSNLVWS